MAKEKPEPRKYMFKNITKGLVHVKELRKTLSPGKEHPYEGVLNPNTERMKDKLLEIKDLGPSDKIVAPTPLEKKAEQAQKEQELTKNVRESLAKLPKKDESKAKVSEVKVEDVVAVTMPPADENKAPLENVETAENKPKKKKAPKKEE